MSLPSLYWILARQCWRLLLWSVSLIALLSFVLALGQCLRLRLLIWPLDGLGWSFVRELLWGGAVILSEAASPIAALIAPMVVGAQAQRTGLVTALETLGKPSAYLHGPALILGAALGGLSMYCAHVQTPHVLTNLAQSALQLSEARWRQVLPVTLSRLLDHATPPHDLPNIHTYIDQGLTSLGSAIYPLDLVSTGVQNKAHVSDQPATPPSSPLNLTQSDESGDSSLEPQINPQRDGDVSELSAWSTWVIKSDQHETSETWLWAWMPERAIFISARWGDSKNDAQLSSTTRAPHAESALKLQRNTLNIQSVSQRTPHPKHQLSSSHIELYDVQLITPHTSLSLDHVSVPLGGPGRIRIQKLFGPPNSLADHQLDPDLVHHRFILHKRSALPLCSLLLCFLGSYWGVRLSTLPMIFYAVGSLAITFGLLRQLELLARAGYISEVTAAWTPLSLLFVWALSTRSRTT